MRLVVLARKSQVKTLGLKKEFWSERATGGSMGDSIDLNTFDKLQHYTNTCY